MSQRTEKYRPTMAGDVLHSWAVDAQAEIDALRKDADRWRWVRANAITLDDFTFYFDEEVQEAIDAAIAAAEKGTK